MLSKADSKMTYEEARFQPLKQQQKHYFNPFVLS